jgi:hypothetical protein
VVEVRRAANATVDEIAPPERKRLGRLGGLLLLTIVSAAAVPASLFLKPAPEPPELLISLAGIVAGALFMAVPWERLPERALYSISIVATGYVAIGVSLYIDDFAFYQVLIAVYTAYVVRDPKDFLWLMAFMAVMTIAPLFYVDQSFDDLAHHTLVTLPVMIISAAVVRYLRNTLAEREHQYRRFAVEAVTLADRIRGASAPHNSAEGAARVSRVKR